MKACPRGDDRFILWAAAPWSYLDDPTIAAYTPSIDGEVLTDSPMNVFAQHRQMDVPMLGGWNAAEWFPFPARALPAAPAALFYTAAGNLFGQQCIANFTQLYPSTDPSNAQASSLLLDGDLGIAEQSWEALHNQSQINKVYAYHFTYTSPYLPLAYHTTEVPFVFGTLTPRALAPTAMPSDADRQMSQTMMNYRTNFAKRGDPNGSGLPTWPTLDSRGNSLLELGNTVAAGDNPDLQRFTYISRYRSAGRLPSEWRSLGSPYLSQYQCAACPSS